MNDEVSAESGESTNSQLGDLLDVLVCPKSKGALDVVTLPSPVCATLIEKYREHFHDEDPVVERGLLCKQSDLIYPIVSDIPIMLIDDALPAAVLTSADPLGEASSTTDSEVAQ